MVDRTEPTFDAVEQSLRDAGVPGEAAEIHGELCGRLCLLDQEAGLPWVAGVMGDAEAPETVILLEAVAARTSCALDAGDMSFVLLLPADEESLELRADGISLWCQGFLHGLGVGAAADQDHSIFKTGATQEIIEDFSQITRAGSGENETEAEGEAGYMELVEFIRVSVQLVYEDLHACRSAPEKPGTH
jgi:hypothetical protein